MMNGYLTKAFIFLFDINILDIIASQWHCVIVAVFDVPNSFWRHCFALVFRLAG